MAYYAHPLVPYYSQVNWINVPPHGYQSFKGIYSIVIELSRRLRRQQLLYVLDVM